MNADQKSSPPMKLLPTYSISRHEVRNKDLMKIIACSEDMEQAKFLPGSYQWRQDPRCRQEKAQRRQPGRR
jgi:hypothetical protein